MTNPYQTKTYEIVFIKPEAPGIKLFSLAPVGSKKPLKFKPGQIVEVSVPGFGEAPFAPCPGPDSKYLYLCVRGVGRVTNKLHLMKVGDKVGIRGPYGNGWPIKSQKLKVKSQKSERKNLLIVVGGLGLISLRTLIWNKDNFLGKKAKVQIFYGARSPQEFLFKSDFKSWQKNGIDINLTIDKKCPGWKGCVGVVTKLFEVAEVIKNARAFLCGPPIMYRFVLEKLKEHHFAEKDIFMSLERRMECGIGVCQHCAIGPYYVCKDGPVFCYEDIKEIRGAI